MIKSSSLIPLIIFILFSFLGGCDALLSNGKWQDNLKQLTKISDEILSSKVVGGSSWQDKLKQLTTGPKENLSPKEQGDLLLKELNLTSSTEPKRFSVDSKNVGDILTASILALFRLGTGAFAEGYKVVIIDRNRESYTILPLGDKKQISETSEVQLTSRASNRQPLVIYDREGNTDCRLVREACSILSLEVDTRPCPVGGLEFTSRLSRKERKELPILQDPNTNVEFKNNGGNDVFPILSYLFKTYGNGKVPWTLENRIFAQLTTALGLLFRLGKGSRYRTSDPPPLPMTLWAYETSPFCKVVTEQLNGLELEYIIIYCPRGSPNRQRMLEEYGRFQVPFLVDPNTGVELWESSAICEYLDKQYSARAPVAFL